MKIGSQTKKVLQFAFKYDSAYGPGIGHIKILGDLIYMNEDKVVKEIAKAWKDTKTKDLPKEVMSPVLNTILNKSSIMALMLSKEVNLPPQVQLPKVKIQ